MPGNFRSSWAAEGGYDFVADALFSELAVDGFFLEFDDERSGSFEPLRFVPEGKMVVLGLVTTKRGELENKDALKRRIDEAAKYVPLDQLCLSPQCGFSSTVEGNVLTCDEQAAKLRLVVDTAAEVWGSPPAPPGACAAWRRTRHRCGRHVTSGSCSPAARSRSSAARRARSRCWCRPSSSPGRPLPWACSARPSWCRWWCSASTAACWPTGWTAGG